jgi:ribosome maturation factor RimP
LVVDHIRELLFSRLKNLGYHLIRVKIINVNNKKTLQIMAERIKDRTMGIDDCTFLSKEISSYLEVDDPISSSYILEVSSGGLSRPLTCFDDYSLFRDSKIKITLKDKFLGKKTYKGFISKVDKNQNIILRTDEHEIKVNFLEIESGNIDPDWAIENNKIN